VVPELARRGWEVAVVGGEPATMRRLLQGVPHHPAASLGAAVLALARLGRQDIVHAHLTAAELAAVVTRPVHRARLVATRHFAAVRGSSRLGSLAARLIDRQLRREIAISAFVARSVDRPTTVVLNPVPPLPPSPLAGRQVLVAQRLEAEKRTQLAIDAFGRSGLAADGWRLVVAGQGAQAAALRDEAVRTPGVELVGQVADLQPLREASSLFLASAPAEPFGLSVAEAMAAGLPVVAAAGGAHLETVGHRRPDLCFPVGDADAAAALLRRLADDETARRQAGAELRADAVERFSVTAHVDGLERAYAEARA
jgi:glycosyltransferase involved in cell wall biosynthesis